MNYQSELTFYCDEKKMTRKINIGFNSSLLDMAFLLYASLVKEEKQSEFSFLFRFGEDIYITRKDEQENLYGYSDEHYHILEEESFMNAVVRKSSSASFEIVYLKRASNLVFDMSMGEIKSSDEKTKPMFLSGSSLLGSELQLLSSSEKDVEENIRKSFPELRKTYDVRKEYDVR